LDTHIQSDFRVALVVASTLGTGTPVKTPQDLLQDTPSMLVVKGFISSIKASTLFHKNHITRPWACTG
jgi:hypothetical protein